MSDTLKKLFGSSARVKLLRLFLFNPRHSFSVAEAAAHSRVGKREARKEVSLLARLELIERNPRTKQVKYSLSLNSPYTEALGRLLLDTPLYANELYERLRTAGAIRLIVVSGVFTGEWNSELDLLVVGERIKERALRERVRLLESEIGREVRYTSLSTADFLYRLNLNDRLVRDVLDYPHRVVHDRLDIGLS